MTATQHTNAGIDFAQFATAEHEKWKLHRRMAMAVSKRAAGADFRGCFGLAMAVTGFTQDSWQTVGEDMLFVPDNTVSWATLTDLPRGVMQLTPERKPVHWATVRPTTVKYGVPTLARGTEKEFAWDFRAMPFSTTRVPDDVLGERTVRPPAHVMDSAKFRHLFRVFNAVETAMTTTATNTMPLWKPHAGLVRDLLGVAQDDPAKPLYAFGDKYFDEAASPYDWFPRAYLAFPEAIRDKVYDRSTRPASFTKAGPTYTPGLRAAFVDAVGEGLAYRARFQGKVTAVTRATYMNLPVTEFKLVGDRGEEETIRFFRETCQIRKGFNTRFGVGDVIANERLDAKVPTTWYDKAFAARWYVCEHRLLPNRIDPVLRCWFDRQGVSLKEGYVHFPAQVASVAALSSADERHLFWEVNGGVDYLVDDIDAFVFPPVTIDRWFFLTGCLPGDVRYDLTPSHPAYTRMVPVNLDDV